MGGWDYYLNVALRAIAQECTIGQHREEVIGWRQGVQCMTQDAKYWDDKPNLDSSAMDPTTTPDHSSQPTRSAPRTLVIELLYFSDCPHYQRALTVLQEAVTVAKLDASIDLVAVETQEEAERHQFYGSPTIRINGVDIVPPDPSASPALACRVYHTAEGALSPLPPVEVINAALHRS